MLREKQGFSRKGAGGFTPIYSRKCQKLGESDPSRRRRKGKQVTSGGRRRRERSQADPWLLCLCLQEEATAPTGWSGQGAGEPIPQPSAGLGRGAEGRVSNGPRGSRSARGSHPGAWVETAKISEVVGYQREREPRPFVFFSPHNTQTNPSKS